MPRKGRSYRVNDSYEAKKLITQKQKSYGRKYNFRPLRKGFTWNYDQSQTFKASGSTNTLGPSPDASSSAAISATSR